MTKKPEPLLPATATILMDKFAICRALGIGVRTFNSMRSRGDYPPPDIKIGTLNKWTAAAHNEAVARLVEKERSRPRHAGGDKPPLTGEPR